MKKIIFWCGIECGKEWGCRHHVEEQQWVKELLYLHQMNKNDESYDNDTTLVIRNLENPLTSKKFVKCSKWTDILYMRNHFEDEGETA